MPIRKVVIQRVAGTSGFMRDYKQWTADGVQSGWRQWWSDGKGDLFKLEDGKLDSPPDEDSRFAINTVIYEGDIDEAEGDIHLAFIAVNYDRKREGLGRKAVQAILDMADKHKVAITLEPMMKGSGGLTTPQLDKWYRRMGWEEWDHPEYGVGPVLIRYPR